LQFEFGASLVQQNEEFPVHMLDQPFFGLPGCQHGLDVPCTESYKIHPFSSLFGLLSALEAAKHVEIEQTNFHIQ